MKGVWKTTKIVFFLCTFCLYSFATLASPAASFFHRSVVVDLKSSSAEHAKSTAQNNARLKAWQQLSRHMVAKEDWDKIPSLSSSQISNLIDSFSVEREKTSDIRYIADLNFTFNPHKVRMLLRTHKLPFSDKEPPKALIIPMTSDGDTFLLWDAQNAWLPIWQIASLKDSLLNILLPMGDLTDQSTLTAQDLMQGNVTAIKKFAKRYGVEHFIIVIAPKIDLPDATMETQLLEEGFAHYNAGEMTSIELYITPLFFDEIKQQRMKIETATAPHLLQEKIPHLLVERLGEQWKNKHVLRGHAANRILLEIPLKSLKHFEKILGDISKLSMVKDNEIKSFSRTKAWVEISFFGEEEALLHALTKQKIDFENPK